MICLNSINQSGFKFDHIVGTGGIGSGIFFSLSGNQTLGRNESRMATLLPNKDFCKQHIIMHYIAVLLGAEIDGKFQLYPIGKVGNDDIGKSLIQQIKTVGMDTKSLGISDEYNTLFSVCFQYPDHTGGNITTDNSASNRVTPENISEFFQKFKLSGSKEIILAVPEVPLLTRIKLLDSGRKRGSLNIASIISSEVDEFKHMHGFEMVDILSINIDEARNIGQIIDESASSNIIIDACIETLKHINPGISILITDGSKGSYCYENNHVEFLPVLRVPVNSTAGAGDAFLAGTIAGLCCGLSLSKGTSDKYFSESPLKSAAELGTLLASLSVTSPDTIHLTANAELLNMFAKKNNINFSPDFLELFKNCTQ
jgi:sugar/nucleoside kinase (ribokinase family)